MKVQSLGGIKLFIEADTLSKLSKRTIKRLTSAIAAVLSESNKLANQKTEGK